MKQPRPADNFSIFYRLGKNFKRRVFKRGFSHKSPFDFFFLIPLSFDFEPPRSKNAVPSGHFFLFSALFSSRFAVKPFVASPKISLKEPPFSIAIEERLGNNFDRRKRPGPPHGSVLSSFVKAGVKMNRVLLLTVLFAALISSSAGLGNEKKSLVIMIDGLRADTCCGAATPNLDALRFGTWADGYKGIWSFEAHALHDTFPNSTPNHVAIATGVFAKKHTVLNNGYKDADNYAAYPTYISRLEKIDPSLNTVFFYNWGEDYWMPLKAKVPYDYTRTFGFGNRLDIHEVDEVISMLDGTSSDQTASDGEFVIQKPWISGSWKAGTDPDAILLYLEGVDPEGHATNFSAFNDKYFSLTTVYDEYVGRLLQAIKSRPKFKEEDWQIVVVSDHGGIKRTHGVIGCNNCYTMPLLVTFKDGSVTDQTVRGLSNGAFDSTRSGQILGQASTADPAAYALLHMTGEVPQELDGRIRPAAPVPENDLTRGILRYDSFNQASEKYAPVGNVAFGVPNGQVGGCLRIADFDSWLPLTAPGELDFTDDGDFTWTLWIKTDDQEHGFLPILGNKNWDNGKNIGFQLAANYGGVQDGRAVNSVEWSLGNGTDRCDLKELELVYGEWNFLAVTLNRGGSAFLYVGHENGRLGFIACDARELGPTQTPFGWNLGQDGRGGYHAIDTKKRSGFPGSVDELAAWNRALSIDEVREAFQRGLENRPLSAADIP